MRVTEDRVFSESRDRRRVRYLFLRWEHLLVSVVAVSYLYFAADPGFEMEVYGAAGAICCRSCMASVKYKVAPFLDSFDSREE